MQSAGNAAIDGTGAELEGYAWVDPVFSSGERKPMDAPDRRERFVGQAFMALVTAMVHYQPNVEADQVAEKAWEFGNAMFDVYEARENSHVVEQES